VGRFTGFAALRSSRYLAFSGKISHKRHPLPHRFTPKAFSHHFWPALLSFWLSVFSKPSGFSSSYNRLAGGLPRIWPWIGFFGYRLDIATGYLKQLT